LYPRVYFPDLTTRASLAEMDSVDLVAFDFLVGAIAAVGVGEGLVDTYDVKQPNFGISGCIVCKIKVRSPPPACHMTASRAAGPTAFQLRQSTPDDILFDINHALSAQRGRLSNFWNQAA
jgi:hypothetical protein